MKADPLLQTDPPSKSYARTDQLLVVACSYSLPPSELLLRLRALARCCGVLLTGVIVANRPESKGQGDADWSVIKGSNRTHDFSAYAEGLAYLLTNGLEPTCVLFINDSLFESHYPSANLRALVWQLPLLSQVQVPAMAGKVDHYSTICHTNPWSGLSLYVSTYCFALNSSALPVLAKLDELANADLGSVASGVSLSSSAWGSGISPSFREFVRTFLVYGHPDFRWPGLGRYETGDGLLAIKARCIYLEHRLSGEIGLHGCILPTNLRFVQRVRLYLSERLATIMRLFGLEPN